MYTIERIPPTPGGKEVAYIWGERSYKKCISKFGPEFQNPNCGHFSYCHPILGSSSVNALSTVGRGVSFRQTGFIIIPLCLLNVNLLHGLFLFFTAEIALSDG